MTPSYSRLAGVGRRSVGKGHVEGAREGSERPTHRLKGAVRAHLKIHEQWKKYGPTLAACAWIREHETVLIQEPPGVGKTHLAVGLGVKAIENGFSVAFFQLEDLLFVMKQAADLAPRALRRKKYLNVALLIIDEMGFQALDRQEASLLFRLVNYRYGWGSILITTNKSVKDWPEILAGDDVMATALLDRLLHRCHVLSIKGRSWRLRDLEARLM